MISIIMCSNRWESPRRAAGGTSRSYNDSSDSRASNINTNTNNVDTSPTSGCNNGASWLLGTSTVTTCSSESSESSERTVKGQYHPSNWQLSIAVWSTNETEDAFPSWHIDETAQHSTVEHRRTLPVAIQPQFCRSTRSSNPLSSRY